MKLKIAAIPYRFERLLSLADFEDKIRTQLAQAAQEGAQLAVYPEYVAMELASLFALEASDIKTHLISMQSYLDDFHRIFRQASSDYSIYVCAGTFPVEVRSGRFHNRSFLFSPAGDYDFQDKIHMTRFENEVWGISPGDSIKVFETEIGRLAINICYDIEFAHMASKQAQYGAQIMLVPSCTDSQAGYQRVSIGCAARALENQFYVVQTSTVGEAEWCLSIDTNYGGAAVYCTPDRRLPPTGVIAQGNLNTCKTLLAEIDLDLLDWVRNHGQVLNFKESFRAASDHELDFGVNRI